jgi:hypothetical protein
MRQFQNTKVSLEIPCDATTDGTCGKAESLQECMEKCKPPVCYWGMYSEKSKACAPVNYFTHKNLNPGFLLRPQPQTTTFMDTQFFEYPPQRKNRLYYYDKIRIQNVETGIILSPDVVIRPTKPYLPHPGIDFIPVTTRTPVLMYDRQLDSVLRVEGMNVNWYKAIDVLNEDFEAFFLERYDPTEDENNFSRTQPPEELVYSDTFKIRTSMRQYISLPPLFNYVRPRLNDLIISDDIYKTPYLFRFIYIPTPVINLD